LVTEGGGIIERGKVSVAKIIDGKSAISEQLL
jgi:hypothetical protein